MSILEEASEAVHGKRQEDYGHPIDNHTRTARLWSVFLKQEITPEQVCFLNILQKIARQMNRPTRDNLVDICGYAANIEMIEEARQQPDTKTVAIW